MADQIESTGDPAAFSAAHDEQDALAQTLAQQIEEFTRQIGRAPFAAASVTIEGIKRIPRITGQGVAGQRDDLDIVLGCFAAFLLDSLALARRQARQKVIEGVVAVIFPMKLNTGALQEALLAQQFPFGLRCKVDVG